MSKIVGVRVRVRVKIRNRVSIFSRITRGTSEGENVPGGIERATPTLKARSPVIRRDRGTVSSEMMAQTAVNMTRNITTRH